MILITFFSLLLFPINLLPFGPCAVDEYFGICAVTVTTLYNYTVGSFLAYFDLVFIMKSIIVAFAIFATKWQSKVKKIIFEHQRGKDKLYPLMWLLLRYRIQVG